MARRPVGWGELYEWALARWGYGPPDVAGRLTASQLTLLWERGQERERREHLERLQVAYVATADALVATNVQAGVWVPRVIGANVTPSYMRSADPSADPETPGKPARIPGVYYEEHLAGLFRQLQARFGMPRFVGGQVVGPNVTVGA